MLEQEGLNNIHMKLHRYLWLALLPLLAVQACKKVPASEFNYDYFEGRSKLVYQENGQDKRVDAIIRMQKDSVLWISLRGGPGIEGARLYATVDSFFMLNRLQKEYYAYSFEELSEELQIPVNIGILQSVMVGNPIPLPASSTVNTYRDGGFKMVQQQVGNLEVLSAVFLQNRKVKEVEIFDTQQKNKIKLSFDDFKQIGYKVMPYRADVSIEYSADSTKNTAFRFDYQRIEIPTDPLRFPFGISGRYEQRYIDFGGNR